MLIIGMSVKAVLMALLTYVCERCGTNGEHEVTRHTRRITVFFIPVLPVGTRYRDMCTACGRVIDISPEQAQWAATNQSSQYAPAGTQPPSPLQGPPAPTPQDRPAHEWPPQDRPA